MVSPREELERRLEGMVYEVKIFLGSQGWGQEATGFAVGIDSWR